MMIDDDDDDDDARDDDIHLRRWIRCRGDDARADYFTRGHVEICTSIEPTTDDALSSFPTSSSPPPPHLVRYTRTGSLRRSDVSVGIVKSTSYDLEPGKGRKFMLATDDSPSAKVAFALLVTKLVGASCLFHARTRWKTIFTERNFFNCDLHFGPSFHSFVHSFGPLVHSR